MPIINLPKFSGDYQSWLEFKELFLSLIHENSVLDSVQKLHYLKASLEGSALQCVQGISFSGENYEIAWKILCERYDNKRLMIHNHIKTMFNIPNLKPDSPWALRNSVDLLSRNLRSLETMEVKTESWDPLIIYLVSNKMDQDTISQWEQCNIQGDLPSILELKSFLIARADLIEKINSHKSNSKSKVPEKSF